MKQLHFQEKYPITLVEVRKSETRFGDIQAIATYFKERITSTPRVAYIGLFDHHAHTKSIQGEVSPQIHAAVNVLFCFGHALPNPQVLAVRPRSIGIADMGDHFAISFMDAPMKPANEAMQAWALGLRHA